MSLSTEKQIERNLVLCQNIIDILNLLENSDISEANIFLKLDEIQSEAFKIREKLEIKSNILKMKANSTELKELYKQVIF